MSKCKCGCGKETKGKYYNKKHMIKDLKKWNSSKKGKTYEQIYSKKSNFLSKPLSKKEIINIKETKTFKTKRSIPYGLNEMENNKEGLCLCGCGGKTTISTGTSNRFGYIKGKPRRYIKYHYNKVRKPLKIDINKTSEQILLGSLLGDGCIYRHKKKDNYTYEEAHKIEHKEYILWKNKNLSFRFGYNKTYGTYRIRKEGKYFKPYYSLFYPNNKKVVTKEILNKLEPLGLAVWYMDDGTYSYRNKSIYLCTHSFSFDENKLMQEWFKKKWNVNCTVINIKNKVTGISYNRIESIHSSLHFNVEDSKKFIEIIKNYMHSIMLYKIGLDKNRIEIAKLKNKEHNNKWNMINKIEREKKKIEFIESKELLSKVNDTWQTTY